ncbi:unnamed protein product [Notodromas monacha]|uniref:Uncharacterized protein n=1 Tax=Notodromas monacha TaxID=399045 RepID=A0A7R9GFR8_9CRUS|nr:unnamed protein product [Notodromas monacha]CAG0919165.1 unnamed protein product [Notodromas monacha]
MSSLFGRRRQHVTFEGTKKDSSSETMRMDVVVGEDRVPKQARPRSNRVYYTTKPSNETYSTDDVIVDVRPRNDQLAVSGSSNRKHRNPLERNKLHLQLCDLALNLEKMCSGANSVRASGSGLNSGDASLQSLRDDRPARRLEIDRAARSHDVVLKQPKQASSRPQLQKKPAVTQEEIPLQFCATLNARYNKDTNKRRKFAIMEPEKLFVHDPATNSSEKRVVTSIMKKDRVFAAMCDENDKDVSDETKTNGSESSNPTTMPDLPSVCDDTRSPGLRRRETRNAARDRSRRSSAVEGVPKINPIPEIKSKWLPIMSIVALVALGTVWRLPQIFQTLADPTGMMATGRLVHDLSLEFPTQEPSMWLTLKHGLHTKGDKNIPHLLLVTSVAEGMETAACLVSRLARYVKELHGDRRVHILDLDTLDAIADTQHLHVPLFFHFSLERDHSVVLLNAQNLKAAGATQLNPFLSQGATYKYPAMAFFVAKLDSNLSESRLGMDETVAKALLGKAWVANGWEEASVRDMLSRTRSTTVFVVPEHKTPCSSGTVSFN